VITRESDGQWRTTMSPLDQTLGEAARSAREFLERLRGTPMRRGGVARARRQRLVEISEILAAHDVPELLARRVALQAVFKCDDGDLANSLMWVAVGCVLRVEVRHLRVRFGLRDRQIAALVPKLSPDRTEVLFEELAAVDWRIARDILNAAINAADPIQTGRRYLAELLK
jgi:hypothetical protein